MWGPYHLRAWDRCLDRCKQRHTVLRNGVGGRIEIPAAAEATFAFLEEDVEVSFDADVEMEPIAEVVEINDFVMETSDTE
jgi:hypothetical protein